MSDNSENQMETKSGFMLWKNTPDVILIIFSIVISVISIYQVIKTGNTSLTNSITLILMFILGIKKGKG